MRQKLCVLNAVLFLAAARIILYSIFKDANCIWSTLEWIRSWPELVAAQINAKNYDKWQRRCLCRHIIALTSICFYPKENRHKSRMAGQFRWNRKILLTIRFDDSVHSFRRHKPRLWMFCLDFQLQFNLQSWNSMNSCDHEWEEKKSDEDERRIRWKIDGDEKIEREFQLDSDVWYKMYFRFYHTRTHIHTTYAHHRHYETMVPIFCMLFIPLAATNHFLIKN